MDSAQEILFGRFPRAVGVTTPDHDNMELRQFLVHSQAEFDGVLDKTEGERNLYSSISAYEPVRVDGAFDGCAVVADKTSFDFDSSAKLDEEQQDKYGPDEETPNWAHPLIPEHASDGFVIDRMRQDDDVRDAVLGDVCHDVRELATTCIDQEMPVLGVFSGFGIHVHQLREPTRSRPSDKLLSNANKWAAKLSLSCVDEAASGRPFRIMRVPNVERICHETGRGTGLFTVPLRGPEMAEITPEGLMDLAAGPRRLNLSQPPSRPSLKVEEDYLGPEYEEGVGQEKMREVPKQSAAEEFSEMMVEKICRMPCVVERALGRNPPNDVRVKLGIMFLNADFSPAEITNIIAGLNWIDFDRSTTQYQLEQLQSSGKGDWSCKTMMSKGLCTRADEPHECPEYGYQGGNDPWQN